ncbi:AcrR family transcriptional regulator [Pedobacter cryoconitis]|uniref:TetR/AcrR family transcriptional regulator n=1 Tax=Pedobacter cryoconitis TaxID=188932 RepID=UPI00161C660B|nr:TetR/AcrR family transcriptional regulator [Pedobacter cryoconitis]MBB6270030.1 AcrR family transcriptional regulator [Pedobacter cryoconitis]
MRPRNKEKEELVKEKTIEMLVTNGFESFSANKLAKECGISMATLYIYYKDKDDLIVQIASEEVSKMRQAVIQGFDPESRFETGLRVQWKNRYQYLIANPVLSLFFDLLRSSSYQDKIYNGFRDDLDNQSDLFIKNATKRGEIISLPVEVYWSVAFSPLHSLIRAHYEGQRSGGKPFILSEEILWQTFELILKALKAK